MKKCPMDWTPWAEQKVAVGITGNAVCREERFGWWASMRRNIWE